MREKVGRHGSATASILRAGDRSDEGADVRKKGGFAFAKDRLQPRHTGMNGELAAIAGSAGERKQRFAGQGDFAACAEVRVVAFLVVRHEHVVRVVAAV